MAETAVGQLHIEIDDSGWRAECQKQYEQELWDKVAAKAAPVFYSEYMIDYRSGSAFLFKDMMSEVADFADAFMAERAKRMKG